MVTIENKGSDAVSTITYFYDGDDQLVETAYDNDGDGFMDSATAYVYAEGRFLSTLVDPDGDGPMAFYEAYESIYDPANNIVGSSSHGPDGSFQQRVQTDFSCR